MKLMKNNGMFDNHHDGMFISESSYLNTRKYKGAFIEKSQINCTFIHTT